MPMKRVDVISTRRLLDDFFKVDEVTVRHERLDGSMSPVLKRLNFERGDGVAALLYKPADQVLVLVRQFRLPSYMAGEGWLLEIVAGMLERAQDATAVMRREVAEETGYEVDNLIPIGSFFLSPGGSSERIHLYFAEVTDQSRSHSGGGRADEDEDIEVVEIPLAACWQMVEDGAISDAKTLIALMWFKCRQLQAPGK